MSNETNLSAVEIQIDEYSPNEYQENDDKATDSIDNLSIKILRFNVDNTKDIVNSIKKEEEEKSTLRKWYAYSTLIATIILFGVYVDLLSSDKEIQKEVLYSITTILLSGFITLNTIFIKYSINSKYLQAFKDIMGKQFDYIIEYNKKE